MMCRQCEPSPKAPCTRTMLGLFVTIQLPQMNVISALPTVTGRRKKELERTYLTAVPACADATTPGGQCADPGWVGDGTPGERRTRLLRSPTPSGKHQSM